MPESRFDHPAGLPDNLFLSFDSLPFPGLFHASRSYGKPLTTTLFTGLIILAAAVYIQMIILPG